MTKSAAKVIKESVPLSLKSLPCRLAATSANKVPRPSDCSITTATGSKRPRADSDSLLCHVRLRRTSRLIFGCGRESGAYADEIEFASLFLLLALLGLYLVGELTHMRSMCVGVAETGIEHRSPAKILKETFLLSRFSLTKRRVQGGVAPSERRRRDGVSGKSHIRGLFPLSRRRQHTRFAYVLIPPPLKKYPPVASRRPVRTKCPDRPTIA